MDSITRNLMILITVLAWCSAIGWHYTPHTQHGGVLPQWLVITTVIVVTTFWVLLGIMKLNGWLDKKAIDSDDDFKIVEREREVVLAKVAEKETQREKDVFDFSIGLHKEENRKRRNKRKASRKAKRQIQGR